MQDPVTGSGAASRLEWRLSPEGVLRWLMIVLLAMHLIGSAGRGIEIMLGGPRRSQLVRLFYPGDGGSLTNSYSYLLTFCSAILLAVIARGSRAQGRRYVWHWRGLALAFLLLSLSGVSPARHLTLTVWHKLARWLGIPQVSAIIAILLVIVLLVLYAGFLRELPADTRRHFALAGGLFVFAAIALDAASALGPTGNGNSTLLGLLPIAAEELLEDVAVVLFIYGLLAYLRCHLRIAVMQLRIC
jgi:hypothetical protein